MKFISERIENILGKGENAGYQHFLLFLKYFQKPSSLGSLEFRIVCSWETSLLKTLWKKKKMLVTSIFSFSNNVFYSINDRNIIVVVYFVVCKCFQFVSSKISLFGNGLRKRFVERIQDNILIVGKCRKITKQ